MATVNVTLSLSSTDLFAKQTVSFTETDSLSPAGDQMLVGRLVTTGSGTEDNISLKALDGTDDRAYVFLHNLSSTTGEYVKIGLCATHGTDSTTGDWFSVLGPGEFFFYPTADNTKIQVKSSANTPTVEFLLLEVD